MRFLNIHDFSVIDRMTVKEYDLRIKAYRLKNVDETYQMHLQAWLNNAVGSADKKGRPIYKTFKKFYDYDKELARINGKKISQDELDFKRKIAEINSRKGG